MPEAAKNPRGSWKVPFIVQGPKPRVLLSGSSRGAGLRKEAFTYRKLRLPFRVWVLGSEFAGFKRFWVWGLEFRVWEFGGFFRCGIYRALK